MMVIVSVSVIDDRAEHLSWNPWLAIALVRRQLTPETYEPDQTILIYDQNL